MKGFLLVLICFFPIIALSQPPWQKLAVFVKKGNIGSEKAKIFLSQTRSAALSNSTPGSERIASIRLLCGVFDNNDLGIENADSLLHYARLLAQTARELKNEEAEAEGLALTVVATSYLKDPLKTLQSGIPALELLRTRKSENGYFYQWEIMDKLVYAYLFLGDYEHARKYADDAIKLVLAQASDSSTNRLLSDSYLTTARLNGYFKKLPLAMSQLDSALKYNGRTGNIQRSYYIKNDWASLRVDNKEPDKAIPVLIECLAYFEQKNNHFGIGEASMLLGKAWLLKKDYSRAIKYAEQAALQPVNARIQVGIYETLHEACKVTGRWKEALAAHEKQVQLGESVFNDKLVNEKQIFESRLAFQKAEQAQAEQKHDAQIQRNIRNAAMISVILLLLLALFLIWNRRLILEKNRLIHFQNARIEALNTGLEAKVAERTMELQQAYDEIKDAMANGQSQERKRVAAELHDTLGSLLSSVNFGLEALGNMNMSDRERKIFKRVVSITDDAYDEVRMLSHNYYPRELEQVGLASALLILTEKLNLYSKTVFQFQAGKDLSRFSKETDNHLYAVCLELVNNIEKHAHATQATIEIGLENAQIRLNVHDNGKGMNVSEAQLEGAGFTNIRERIGALAGTLSVASSDLGTVFTIQAPATVFKETESNHA